MRQYLVRVIILSNQEAAILLPTYLLNRTRSKILIYRHVKEIVERTLLPSTTCVVITQAGGYISKKKKKKKNCKLQLSDFMIYYRRQRKVILNKYVTTILIQEKVR